MYNKFMIFFRENKYRLNYLELVNKYKKLLIQLEEILKNFNLNFKEILEICEEFLLLLDKTYEIIDVNYYKEYIVFGNKYIKISKEENFLDFSKLFENDRKKKVLIKDLLIYFKVIFTNYSLIYLRTRAIIYVLDLDINEGWFLTNLKGSNIILISKYLDKEYYYSANNIGYLNYNNKYNKNFELPKNELSKPIEKNNKITYICYYINNKLYKFILNEIFLISNYLLLYDTFNKELFEDLCDYKSSNNVINALKYIRNELEKEKRENKRKRNELENKRENKRKRNELEKEKRENKRNKIELEEEKSENKIKKNELKKENKNDPRLDSNKIEEKITRKILFLMSLPGNDNQEKNFKKNIYGYLKEKKIDLEMNIHEMINFVLGKILLIYKYNIGNKKINLDNELILKIISKKLKINYEKIKNNYFFNCVILQQYMDNPIYFTEEYNDLELFYFLIKIIITTCKFLYI